MVKRKNKDYRFELLFIDLLFFIWLPVYIKIIAQISGALVVHATL